MTAVVFDPTAFKAGYPAFAAVSNASLQFSFNAATMYLSNADTSPVQDIPTRTTLLYMLTAHVSYLGGSLNGGNAPLPVGRTSQAAEGSVSASFDYGTPGSDKWYSQSQWGAMFWQATLNLRMMRYRPRPTYIR